jgi:chaperonin GroEL
MDRIDDAICATRAALEEGILPGGGYAYYKAWINEYPEMEVNDTDEIDGKYLVYQSILAPVKLIMENSGLDSIKNFTNKFIGYNAKADKFEDLKLAGVIDPTKVTRMALENAASIAGMVLLTSCCVSNV